MLVLQVRGCESVSVSELSQGRGCRVVVRRCGGAAVRNLGGSRWLSQSPSTVTVKSRLGVTESRVRGKRDPPLTTETYHCRQHASTPLRCHHQSHPCKPRNKAIKPLKASASRHWTTSLLGFHKRPLSRPHAFATPHSSLAQPPHRTASHRPPPLPSPLLHDGIHAALATYTHTLERIAFCFISRPIPAACSSPSNRKRDGLPAHSIPRLHSTSLRLSHLPHPPGHQ